MFSATSPLPEWRPGQDYQKSYSADPKQGGVLRDLSHEVDYARLLFGECSSIIGSLYTTGRLGIDSEEGAEGLWETESGVQVSLSLDYLSRIPIRFIRASGSAGELVYNFLSGGLSCHHPG
jgi:hypothetical protein